MLYIYGFFCVVGSILLGFSLFGGHDSDGDIGHTDIDFDTGSDLHLDADLHVGVETDVTVTGNTDMIIHGETGLGDSILSFLSVRNLMFFGAFFGATGLTLSFLNFPSFLTFISSFGVGATLGVSSHFIFSYLKNNEILEESSLSDFVGMTGVVSVPVSKNRSGKIVVTHKGRTVHILAVLEEDEVDTMANVGEMVYIVSMRSDKASIIVYKDISLSI